MVHAQGGCMERCESGATDKKHSPSLFFTPKIIVFNCGAKFHLRGQLEWHMSLKVCVGLVKQAISFDTFVQESLEQVSVMQTGEICCRYSSKTETFHLE